MIKVFKFGGASVKNADGVRNLLKVLNVTGHENKLIVVSAMGKTTNALEKVLEDYLDHRTIPQSLLEVKDYHQQIIDELFGKNTESISNKIHSLFTELENFLQHNKSKQYDFVYDQIVSFGELLSTTIVSEYLNLHHIKAQWLDARELIKTDSTYRDAQVNWDKTQSRIKDRVDEQKLNIIQGFIAADPNNFTTTLGREGSDYSAAILAYCLNAESVTIWKDVPGVLNADPRYFNNAQLLTNISYEEAIELAFYGASVIHPKTLQPLQGKEIPLFVRSFLNPSEEGTAVSKGKGITPEIPCFIVKKEQVLISLSSLDFSFIMEENISEIFKLFHQYQMKVDLIQNSAISFRVCVDNRFNHLEQLVQHLRAKFKVDYKTGVSLFTIRHFDQRAIEELEKDKKVLLKQRTQNTVQLVTEN